MLTKIRKELATYTRPQKLFILCAMICGFCICAEYSICKPTSKSIFLATYSARLLPYAWLVVLPFNFIVVSLYNRYLTRLGCYRMFLMTIGITAAMNLFCAFFMKGSEILPFIHYVFKDIYVLLMFQQLWSVIHSHIEFKRAKYLYGIIFAFGGLGSVFGSCIPGFFAVKVGSCLLLLMTVPLYSLFAIAYYFTLKLSGFLKGSHKAEELSFSDARGFSLVRSSRYLMYILAIVILMQLSATLTEFLFDSHIEKVYPNIDLRTEYLGRLFGIVNSVNVVFQIFGAFLLLKVIGLRKSHYLIPSVLACNAIAMVINPTFAMISMSYGAIKSFDYSIFAIIKEMLYIPLKVEEKFKAKAIIDVFSYRSAKAIGALIVFCLEFIYPNAFPYPLFYVPISIFCVWLVCLYFMFKSQQAEVLI